MTFSAVMDAKVPIGMYVCSAHMDGDISYGAAPTSAVDCYYSFAVDMKFFFSAAMDASAPQ